jgi:DNA modification methylase
MRGEHTVGETSSLKGGLTRGTTIHPFDGGESKETQSGTSIFDPVLCELVYRWFCPPEGSILDPFAGGSVRGIVASKLKRNYTGIDLCAHQLTANRKQGKQICSTPAPRWIEGNSANAETLAPGNYDLLFSCPPYGDLERYSDDPDDLSTMDWPAFLATYRTIVAACCRMLKPDSFACFVVGDIRDKKGMYRNLIGETVRAFQDAGTMLYNEAILVTAVGSLPIRVAKQFEASRKLGKTHQNVLVFVKGIPERATKAIGLVECGELLEPASSDVV